MVSTSTPTSSISSTATCLATIMAPTQPNRLLGSLALVRSGPRSITRESSNSALKLSGDPSPNEVTQCTLIAGRLVVCSSRPAIAVLAYGPEAPWAIFKQGRKYGLRLGGRTVDAASLTQAGASA